MSYFIGIDPGKSGAAVFMAGDGRIIDRVKFSETEHDIAEAFWEWKEIAGAEGVVAMLEKVHSRPGQGVRSVFTFGRQFGFMVGVLTALKIPYGMVTPNKWQKAMRCLTKGDKNVSKASAQRLYPSEKMTHAIADATLIAAYALRQGNL